MAPGDAAVTSLIKSVGTIGTLTLVSRVLGLVRDNLFARYMGASFASDAFLIAFKLPNMFRALFAEGANLTDSRVLKYAYYRNQFLYAEDSGRRFKLGARVNF
jgi:peptidoglycan biosynthesis protein MviN/MurJ (putative lipid II flippase)